jgi:hypothetical protein
LPTSPVPPVTRITFSAPMMRGWCSGSYSYNCWYCTSACRCRWQQPQARDACMQHRAT